MGTNFYMMTADKDAAIEWFCDDYTVTDFPQWGYEIHIAKTSWGWKTLWEAHKRIHSVNDLKIIYSTGKFTIYDEYGEIYTWDEFKKRVIDWNKDNPNACVHINPDRSMPNFNEIYGRYYDDSRYFLSADGYEFCEVEFS